MLLNRRVAIIFHGVGGVGGGGRLRVGSEGANLERVPKHSPPGKFLESLDWLGLLFARFGLSNILIFETDFKRRTLFVC